MKIKEEINKRKEIFDEILIEFNARDGKINKQRGTYARERRELEEKKNKPATVRV